MKHNRYEVKLKSDHMLLAGDIGGTKTLLGLFDAEAVRPRALLTRSFGTLEFDDLPSMIRVFLDDAQAPRAPLDCACVGVAGPVLGDSATLTNVPWKVEGRRVAEGFKLSHVHLLNDLEAMAWSITVLNESEVQVLQEGIARRGGNIALIAHNPALARALFQRAIESDPTAYRATRGVASVFLLNRDFDSASRAFDAARSRTQDKDEMKFISAALGDLQTIRVR